MSKILVVDDDPDIVRALAIRLRAEGHEVLTAHDVDAGAIAAREERPDLAILDVSMPGGNGLDMAGRLQADATTLGTFPSSGRRLEPTRPLNKRPTPQGTYPTLPHFFPLSRVYFINIGVSRKN